MTPNVPLLTKVLDHITAHPEEHDQGEWAIRRTECGTAYCVGGWAVVMSGHELRWVGCYTGVVADSTVDGREIEFVAQDELGLSDDQAILMFSAANTLRQLWQMAAQFTHGEITPPPEFAP